MDRSRTDSFPAATCDRPEPLPAGSVPEKTLIRFNAPQNATVNRAVALAEELVSNSYKMSTSQWLSRRFDINTLATLKPNEIVHGPFAQIIRYEGKRKNTPLGSGTYDFYKICLQDHSILAALEKFPDLKLLPFVLYIVVHELVHIVRFTQFLQSFQASPDETMAEEARVHAKTHDILSQVQIPGIIPVFQFYERWRQPIDDMKDT